MQWLSIPEEFRRQVSRLAEVLEMDRRLPAQLLKVPAAAVVVLEFDELRSESFVEAAQHVSSALGAGTLYMGVLQPDPQQYFYRHFSKYPWLELSASDPPTEVIAALYEDPGGSPADAIGINSDVIVAYCGELRWLVVGDRDLEVAILAFLDDEAQATWRSNYGAERLRTVEEALETLLPAIFGASLPSGLAASFRSNHGQPAGGRAKNRRRSRRRP